MATTPPDLLESAAKAPGDGAAAARILPLVDLTSLADDDTEAQIETLCARAIDAGVAGVCVWPRFVPMAKARLDHTPLRLATVANFPEGSDDLARAARDTADALAAGADEVDVVAPIQAILDGDIGLVTDLVQACRKAAPDGTLKVILETGRLAEPARIAAAARAAIMGGCDMLRTSTGRFPVGATLEAAAVLLAVIEEADGRIGIKFSGGIRPRSRPRNIFISWIISSARAGPHPTRFGSAPPPCSTTCSGSSDRNDLAVDA
jgi:deoxyribose-phosphate aldolase